MLSSCHPAAQVRMRSSWEPPPPTPHDRASEEARAAGPRAAGRTGRRAREAGGAGEALRGTVLGSRGHSGMVTTAFGPELLPRAAQPPLSQEKPLDGTCSAAHRGGLTAGAAARLQGRRSAPAHAPRLRDRAPPEVPRLCTLWAHAEPEHARRGQRGGLSLSRPSFDPAYWLRSGAWGRTRH